MESNDVEWFVNLKRLSKGTPTESKNVFLGLGRKKLFKWFSFIAKQILSNDIPLPGPTKSYLFKNSGSLELLSDKGIS